MDVVRNIWLDGIMGVVVGDALGVPVEFKDRSELIEKPVKSMQGYGTYNLPAGSWSDDSSMTLATLDSLRGGFDPEDIMNRFVRWMTEGKYTPFGETFDVGNTCCKSIIRYLSTHDIDVCGGSGEKDNGNGSLMRILPVCLYAFEKHQLKELTDKEAIEIIHIVSALTHAHVRSKIACGLYYYMVKAILEDTGSLLECLQEGLNNGIEFYEHVEIEKKELYHYRRLLDLDEFKDTSVEQISSYGYVVVTLEAAIWCLINTKTYSECVLKAVNLGYDTDTVAAIAGGLAGLYYGYEAIPKVWLDSIHRRKWIEELCK